MFPKLWLQHCCSHNATDAISDANTNAISDANTNATSDAISDATDAIYDSTCDANTNDGVDRLHERFQQIEFLVHEEV